MPTSVKEDDFPLLLMKVLKGQNGKEVYESLRCMNNMNACYRVVLAGEYILHEDTQLQQVLFVFRGEFSVWKSSVNGKQYLEQRFCAPQFMGIDRALEVEYKNKGGVIAIQNCEILILNPDYFLQLLSKNGELSVEVLRNILTKMSMSMVESARKSLYGAADRMLVYLYNYISGSRREKVVYRITLTKKELADSIGVTDRTLYRVLNKLKREHYLSGIEGCILVDQEQLKKIKAKVVLLLNE